MKFVADENVDLPIIARLRNDGHDVYAVIEMSAGISDDEVLKQANQQGVVLLTSDKDFGELVYRDKRFTCGIVLIRLAGLSNNEKVEIVASVINEHASELGNAFTVISRHNLRIPPRIYAFSETALRKSGPLRGSWHHKYCASEGAKIDNLLSLLAH